MDIADIPSIPNREKRVEEITVDCYDEYEVLSAFEVYLSDALRMPFAATWGTPGTSPAEHATVLGVAGMDEREGVHLRVRGGDGDEYEVLADQLWADEAGSANAIVLDHYRAYVASGDRPFLSLSEYHRLNRERAMLLARPMLQEQQLSADEQHR